MKFNLPHICLLGAAALCFASPLTHADLGHSTPEAQGISANALLDFVEAADVQVDTMNSFMLVRHGQIIAQGWWNPYDPETPHVLYSLTKSFTSTAVGLAAAEGKLSINDPLLSFFPDDAPADPSANLKAMRLRDLLRMSTGQHAEDVAKFENHAANENWTKDFLAIPVAHKPGTHFFYNSPGSYMLSASVQKAVGEKTRDFLMPRLFKPLGIENPLWKESPQGVNIGSYGLNLRTEEIARFGQLYLQKGQWNGRQLVPVDWVEQATSLQTSNGSDPTSEWEQGYGYQFWRCRYGFYRGDGAFGQFCIVMPQYDAVVAITSGSRNMQAVMNLVWQYIVPGLKFAALPEDHDADARLEKRLAELSIHPIAPNPQAAPKPGFVSKRFLLPENNQLLQKLSLTTDNHGRATLALKIDGADEKIVCGDGKWIKGSLNSGLLAARYLGIPDTLIGAEGAWTAPDTYVAKIVFYQTPIYMKLQLKFSGDTVSVKRDYNVGFKVFSEPELIGHAE